MAPATELRYHPAVAYLCDPAANAGRSRTDRAPLRWHCPFPDCAAVIERSPANLLYTTARCDTHARPPRRTRDANGDPWEPVVFPRTVHPEVVVALRWSLLASPVVPVDAIHARLHADGIQPLPVPRDLDILQRTIHAHAALRWKEEANRKEAQSHAPPPQPFGPTFAPCRCPLPLPFLSYTTPPPACG